MATFSVAHNMIWQHGEELHNIISFQPVWNKWLMLLSDLCCSEEGWPDLHCKMISCWKWMNPSDIADLSLNSGTGRSIFYSFTLIIELFIVHLSLKINKAFGHCQTDWKGWSIFFLFTGDTWLFTYQFSLKMKLLANVDFNHVIYFLFIYMDTQFYCLWTRVCRTESTEVRWLIWKQTYHSSLKSTDVAKSIIARYLHVKGN